MGSAGRSWKCWFRLRRRRRQRPRRRLQPGGDQAVDEVGQLHAVEVVVADAEHLAGGINAAAGIELGGVHAQVDVGHEGAEDDDAVALLDELGNLLAAHAAFVDADEQRMPLADDALVLHGGGHGDARPLGQRQQPVLQAETMDFHPGEDHRPPRGGDPPHGFGHRLGEHLGIAGGLLDVPHVGSGRHGKDHVAGQLDVARPPITQHGGQDAVDLAEGDLRIVQHGVGDAEAVEDLGLGAEILDLVVQEGIVEALPQAGRPADDHDRRLLGIGAGDRIAEAQPTYAIGHADGADAVDARVGVGGEAGAVLAGAADDAQRAALDLRIEREHVIARHAEHVADAAFAQPPDQVLADRQPRDGRRAIRGCALVVTHRPFSPVASRRDVR